MNKPIPSQEATALQNAALRLTVAIDPTDYFGCEDDIRLVANAALRPPTPAADQQTERDALEAAWRDKQIRTWWNEGPPPDGWGDAFKPHFFEGWMTRSRACFAGGSPARDVEAPAAINQDSARIDWLASKGCVTIADVIGLDRTEHIEVTDGFDPYGTGATLREAIDAAMMAVAPIGSDK